MAGYNTEKTPTGPNPMGGKSMGPSETPEGKAVIPALPLVTEATEEEIHRTIK